MNTLKDIRILIVDDNKELLALIRYFIEKQGYSVDEALNGAEAYKLIKQNKYDGMILDIEMPIMDGTALIHKLYAESILLPTLIYSAHWECDLILSLVSSGVLNFIPKSVEPKDIIAPLAEVIKRGDKINDMLKNTSGKAAELVNYSKKGKNDV